MKTTVKTLAALAAMATMGAVQAQGLPSSIWFDGYCDGFSSITDVGGGVVTGYYDLSNCSGYGDMLPAVGAGGSLKNTGVNFTGASFDATGWGPLFRIDADGTGMLYWPSGNSLMFTWTAGLGQQGLRSGPPALAPR